ncbi:MAG: hypothetical protein JWO31_4316 [Phycisphaerales bacterium]|nr:hypothetical protein [Phycisphaerales bacterium]
MPVLPMFDRPTDPDAWHRVAAPGGYEWWYFDAEDAAGRYRLVGIFLEGFVFHPGYLRRYTAYRRNPTRRPPPVAGEFPCAYFVLYDGDTIVGQFMEQVRPGDFAASAERPDVRVGASRFRRDADGAYRLSMAGTPWRLTWRGPRRADGQVLSADLTFRPLSPPGATERRFLSRALSGAEHRWVVADPLCDVSGTIHLGPAPVTRADGSVPLTAAGAAAGAEDRPAVGQTIAFAGRGYHDHNYGTAPIGPGLKRWVWGRAIVPGAPAAGGGDRMYTFHFARARDRRLPDEVHLVRADAAGRADVPVAAAAVDWSRRSPLGLAYPAAINFPPYLALSNPRVIDSTPFYLRLVYDAAVDGGASRTTAFCEVAYPHRLRWPVLGRMIELSIHRPG